MYLAKATISVRADDRPLAEGLRRAEQRMRRLSAAIRKATVTFKASAAEIEKLGSEPGGECGIMPGEEEG